MEVEKCDRPCDNNQCKDRLTPLYDMSHRNIKTADLSMICGKYIKPIDPQIDDLIKRKIEDN